LPASIQFSLNVIANLIRRLNNALGVTSIIVTYDAAEALHTTDLIYLMADGVIVGQGTPDALRESTDPYVHQFVHAEADGPVAFRYPAKPYEAELGLLRATAGRRRLSAACAMSDQAPLESATAPHVVT